MTHEEKVEGELVGINQRILGLEAAITHRLAAIEGRLMHLQTIGTWLFAGLLGAYAAILASYAAVLAVALRGH